MDHLFEAADSGDVLAHPRITTPQACVTGFKGSKTLHSDLSCTECMGFLGKCF